MTSYIITIKSSNHIQPSNTYINPIQIEHDKTIGDYFSLLIKNHNLSTINAYTFNNKYIGYDYSLTTPIKKVFKSILRPIIHEIPFTVPINPFKRVNWIMTLYSKNLFDVVNLNGVDPINRASIGTWHKWGTIKKDALYNNHPDNLVIIKHLNNKYAYNKHCLLNLIKTTKTNSITMPHNNININKSFIVDKLHVFREILPIIDIDCGINKI
jgi:hypothetical protein